METKKDIGQGVKEKLGNYSSSPRDVVWHNIKNDLSKRKKKKRIIIFWFSVVGSLLIGMAILYTINGNDADKEFNRFDTNQTVNNNLTNAEKKDSINTTDKTINESLSNQPFADSTSNEAVVGNDKKSKPSILDNVLSKTNNHDSRRSSENPQRKEPLYPSEKKLSDHKDILDNSEINLQDSNRFTDGINTTKRLSIVNDYDNISIGETIESKKVLTDSTLQDTLAKPTKREFKPLAESDQEKQNDAESKTDKWSIYPNVSLVHYDGFKRSFSNQNSFNYGLYLTYLPSNRASFRLGVHNLNLQQTSNSNLGYDEKQEISYLEIPIEIKYAFIDKKIRVSVIGGFSYLILQDATITQSLNDGPLKYSNKNQFTNSTLSLNIGIEFQTKIYNKLYFNVEPFAKYHITPYSASKDFYPFTISIIGGLEYKF
ncbi:MAG: hypothetical protein R2797_04030 [Gelidibacter sp.]